MSLKNKKRTYPHRDVQIILDAELSAERDALMAEVATSKKSPSLVKQIKDLEDRMRDSILTIRVMGVPRAEYVKIQGAHPGKTKLQAFNPDTFFPDFIYKTGYAVEADGTLEKLSDLDRHEWDQIADGFTDAEFTELANAVHEVNVQRVNPGFLSHGSAQTEPSPTNSEPPEPGE